ncbi:MAG: hypothetical protein GY864_05970 [Desulfobacterales bacterium]|nr:hypothetical protein [Desulfobacterales bacterium]
MIYIIYISLAVVASLVALNSFLRGERKTQIDAVLRFLLIGTLIAAFAILGFKHGLLAIVIASLLTFVVRPVTARLASKLLSSRTEGKYVGLPPRTLRKISRKLGKPIDPNKIDEACDRYDNAESELFAYCESHPPVKMVMDEFQISRDGLKEIYFGLSAAGASQWCCGHWVVASALAYPESLRYILSRRRSDIDETCFNLIMYFEHGTFGI